MLPPSYSGIHRTHFPGDAGGALGVAVTAAARDALLARAPVAHSVVPRLAYRASVEVATGGVLPRDPDAVLHMYNVASAPPAQVNGSRPPVSCCPPPLSNSLGPHPSSRPVQVDHRTPRLGYPRSRPVPVPVRPVSLRPCSPFPPAYCPLPALPIRRAVAQEVDIGGGVALVGPTPSTPRSKSPRGRSPPAAPRATSPQGLPRPAAASGKGVLAL
jgi:hypothetical protein